MLKNGLKLFLRVIGICGLVFLLGAVWYGMEIKEPKEMAEVVFAGTENDGDCTILFSREACVMVDTHMRPASPMMFASRSFISFAALLVKVIAIMFAGDTPFSSTR